MYYSDFIVKRTKGFFCFSFKNRSPKDAAWKIEDFLHTFSSRKRRANQRKQIQGDVFLFDWKWHAKFKALLQKKETQLHARSSLSMVLHSPLHFTVSLLPFGASHQQSTKVFTCYMYDLFAKLQIVRLFLITKARFHLVSRFYWNHFHEI